MSTNTRWTKSASILVNSRRDPVARDGEAGVPNRTEWQKTQEIAPGPTHAAHVRTARSLLMRFLVSLLTLVGTAPAAGCVTEHAQPLDDCAPGVWLNSESDCYCDEQPILTETVPECAAADCRRSNVLIVHPDGGFAESHIFIAESQRTFSLFAGQLGSVGTWTATADALTVTLNRTETRREGTCSASSLVLNGVSWTRAAPELEEAAWAAWAADDWAGVPIQERD